MVTGSDGYPLPAAPPALRSFSRALSRSTLATIEAAATTTNLESALWYERTLPPQSSATWRPNLPAFTSHEST